MALRHAIPVLFAAISALATGSHSDAVPAFPDAVGQGAAARSGRGGDVYHVTNLSDYNRKRKQSPIPGSLRYGIESAKGPRTIVFDVSGPLPLDARLRIESHQLTIAGQTSPGGVTIYGYPVEIDGAKDIVIRYLRVRCGDFHARGVDRGELSHQRRGHGNQDLDAGSANAVDVGGGSELVVLDHLSTSWGMDETCSVTNARNITVQNCIIAESLHNSFHPKGRHGYGSLVRGDLTPADQARGSGGYTLYGNLWAHHQQRSPSIGGQQKLARGQREPDRRRTDVNVVNNVVYNWGQRPSHRSELGDVRINFVGNYHVNGPSKSGAYVFHDGTPSSTFLFQRDNYLDADQDAVHDGRLIATPEAILHTFRSFDNEDRLLSTPEKPFNFFGWTTGVIPADENYHRVIDTVGASLWRDSADRRVIDSVVHRTGGPIDSQETFRQSDGVLPGIDDLVTARRPVKFDTDGDGMPDDFEREHGLDPQDAHDNNGKQLDSRGYTNLEIYLDSLTRP